MLDRPAKQRKPLPLQRDLAPFTLLERCEFCGELTFATDRCQSSDEARSCVPAETDSARFVGDRGA